MYRNMRKSFLMTLLTLCVAISVQARPLFGEQKLFVDDWRFKLESGDKIKVNDDAEKWRRVTLPHDWSVEGHYSPTYASATGYLPGGLGWYAKSFTVPESAKGKKEKYLGG
jgi:hypothetical protein